MSFYATISRAALERMLESAKAYRSKINHKIAWCCTVPPLGWLGRLDRLEREYARANNGVRDLIVLLCSAPTSPATPQDKP